MGVLDPEGNVRRVAASGTRVFFPEIPGVGTLRQRYPIAPIHNEGSQIFKEVEALKDIVMRMDTYQVRHNNWEALKDIVMRMNT